MIKLIFSTNERRSKGQASRLSGDYSGKVTPVPIPNTVVKLPSAENTWRATAREHKSLPELLSRAFLLSKEFFSMLRYSSIAQSVEHAAVNRRVVGSSPTGGAMAPWSSGQDTALSRR